MGNPRAAGISMEPVRTEPLLIRINLDVGPYGAETAKCSALIARTSCANSASVTGVASPLAATQPPSVARTQGSASPHPIAALLTNKSGYIRLDATKEILRANGIGQSKESAAATSHFLPNRRKKPWWPVSLFR